METLKDILEIIYYLSGPCLVLIAYKALDQIKVSKKIAETSNKREAYKIAIEEVRFYSDEIIPLINRLDKKIAKHDIKFIKNIKNTITEDSLTIESFKMNKEDDDLMLMIIEDVSDLFNKLESFSNFFTSAIADEMTAYHTTAETYCSTVKQYSIYLALERKDDMEHCIMELFYIWNNRLNKERLINEKKSLEERIKNSSDKAILPLGT